MRKTDKWKMAMRGKYWFRQAKKKKKKCKCYIDIVFVIDSTQEAQPDYLSWNGVTHCKMSRVLCETVLSLTQAPINVHPLLRMFYPYSVKIAFPEQNGYLIG